MKKQVLILIIIVAVLICIGLIAVGNIYKPAESEKSTQMSSTNSNEVQESNKKSNDNDTNLEKNNSANSKENKTIEINNRQDNGKFEIIEIEKSKFESDYTIIDEREIYNKIINIEKENNNVTITRKETEENNNILALDEKSKVKSNTKYNIENIKAAGIKDIFIGEEGHEGIYPLIYILQKDGTVKGIDIEEAFKTGTFVAQNISELKNVEKIEQADVHPKDDSGYMAIVITTSDKKIYELRKKD